ncbi:MAG: hypothetical protein P4L53_12400 [Candidatus Obscuribacterales bacterium]|nr:hypothetical protein [Candidatus Obscuribacterales bacterium]
MMRLSMTPVMVPNEVSKDLIANAIENASLTVGPKVVCQAGVDDSCNSSE